MRLLRRHRDDDRVDGRDLPCERDEPGSDDLLLLGLLLLLRRRLSDDG